MKSERRIRKKNTLKKQPHKRYLTVLMRQIINCSFLGKIELCVHVKINILFWNSTVVMALSHPSL